MRRYRRKLNIGRLILSFWIIFLLASSAYIGYRIFLLYDMEISFDFENTRPEDTVQVPNEPVEEPQTPVEEPILIVEPEPEPEPVEVIEEIYIEYIKESGFLELPLNGATGFAAVELNMHSERAVESQTIISLSAGQAFTVLEEYNEWWKISFSGEKGWVLHQYCFINLPDIIPSIIYNISNSSASLFKSSGESIPNITGRALYDAKVHSERFDKDMYLAPILYAAVPKISAAQQKAIADGNSLIIYEAFRPFDVQMNLVTNLKALMEANEKVTAGLTTPPWSLRWFLSQGVSNHQRGLAIDVSLAQIITIESRTIGSFKYKAITEYLELPMPTKMHELSLAAIVFSTPVAPTSPTDWIGATPAPTMTPDALLLQKYLTTAGFTPLSSEWWHFNDLDLLDFAMNTKINGRFFLSENVSVQPEILSDQPLN